MAQSSLYPALNQVLGGGFNQDFAEIFGGPEDVIAHFTSDPIDSARVPREVDRLLASGSDLDQVLLGLGNNYSYDYDGLTAAEWLTWLKTRFQEEAPPPDPEVGHLVGTTVHAVTPLGEHGIRIELTTATIDLPEGCAVSSPAGTAARPPNPRALPLVQEATGCLVIACVVRGVQLELATDLVDFSTPRVTERAFTITPKP